MSTFQLCDATQMRIVFRYGQYTSRRCDRQARDLTDLGFGQGRGCCRDRPPYLPLPVDPSSPVLVTLTRPYWLTNHVIEGPLLAYGCTVPRPA